MSKKYFINNLDTDFGQALIKQLVKQPTEDPVHMCTVRVPVDTKPQGIKKVLKRQKPKLFRKKAIEETEVYVYSLEQTEISDIQFGIEMMGKPFEDNKVFILVSDIMVWSNSERKIKKDPPPPPKEQGQGGQEPPQQQKEEEQKQAEQQSKENQNQSEVDQEVAEQKPIQYTFFEDGDYQSRIPLEHYQYIKQIEEKVMAIKKENIKVFIVCPGIIYGCGQNTFYNYFRAAWLQQPSALPYLGEGNNQIPTIHLKDLVKLVIKVAQSPPENLPYILAIDQTEDRSQKKLIQTVSLGIGSGKVAKVEDKPVLMDNVDRFMLNLDMRSSKILVGTVEQPAEFQWSSKKGITECIKSLLGDFCQKQKLRPMKLFFLKPEPDWKQSKIEYIFKTFADYYKIPVLSLKSILNDAKQMGDEDLSKDIIEQWDSIMKYVNSGQSQNNLDEALKVFYRAVRWRLTQNDCINRGFILDNFPRFDSELQFVFNKMSMKKFKRKVKKPQPPKTAKSIVSEGQKEGQEQEKKEEQPQQKEQQPQPQAEEEVPEGEGEQNAPKYEPYFPQTLITVKRSGAESPEQIVEFFTSKNIEQLSYDTTERKEHQIFQSLRNHIERNGRPNNYLIPEEELLSKHKDFVLGQNKVSLDQRDRLTAEKKKYEEDIEAKRKKLADEMIQLIKNEGEEEIKKMPFRNYLMEFVVPTLNLGLLEVSNIIPNDPVDLLAEFLYDKSYDV